jgi:hypothetical protein
MTVDGQICIVFDVCAKEKRAQTLQYVLELLHSLLFVLCSKTRLSERRQQLVLRLPLAHAKMFYHMLVIYFFLLK